MRKSDIELGWEACMESMGISGAFMGAGAAAIHGESYVSAVDDAIHAMEEAINKHPNRGQDLERFKGFVLEEWAAGTFNIDAIASGSSDKATALHENGYGSVDVRLEIDAFSEDYSMKAYRNAKESAKEQARLNPDTREAVYKGQKRLIVEDYLEDAKKTAMDQYKANIEKRPDVAEAYLETEQQLTDRIKNGKGVEGKPIDSKKLKKVTKAAKQGDEQGNFCGEDFDITLRNSIQWEYVMKQALKAGYSAAVISAAFQLTPEMFKIVNQLIKEGKLSIDDLTHLGEKTIETPATGFINGYLACSLQIMVAEGALGEALKGVGPEWIGATVALITSTIKDSILVAIGKKSAREMGAAFVDNAAIGGGMVLGQMAGLAIGEKFVQTAIGLQIVNSAAFIHINGAITQIIGFEFPIIGYVIGSLIGTAISIAYNFGKKKLLSLCVDTGFTCFGLVEQNYEMPVDYLQSIGVDVLLPSFIDADYIEPDYIEPDYLEADCVEPETIKFYQLKRGIIGVNKIGYIPA